MWSAACPERSRRVARHRFPSPGSPGRFSTSCRLAQPSRISSEDRSHFIGRILSVAFRQGTASAVPQESEGNAALAAEVRKRTCETQPLNQRDLTAVGEMQPAGQAAVLRRRVRILRLSTSGRRSLRIRRIRYARKRTSGSRWTGSAHAGRTGHPHKRAASNPHRRRQ
jgi:hypothetical protein